MNIAPSNSLQFVSPFSTLNRESVSLEEAEDKAQVLPPVEETSSSAAGENQRDLNFDNAIALRLQLQQDRNPEEQAESPESDDVAGPQQAAQQQQRRDESEASAERAVEQAQEQQNQAIIQELSARDREVRAHEQAHAAVGGQYAGAPVYEFTRGPDGINYATSGEVSISTSAVPNDPEATLRKAEVIKAAALAPAEPSEQDRAVAAQATQIALEARAEIARLEAAEQALEDEQRLAAEEEARVADAEQNDEPEAVAAETDDDERDAENAQLLDDLARRNQELNQRVLDAGLFEEGAAAGSILDQVV